MKGSTVIIYFSNKGSLIGKSLSSFSENADSRIAFLLYRSTLAKIKRSGLPVIFSDESNQSGNSLGWKLANSFQQAYHEGFENVIAVGDDTPGLQTSHLLEAARSLESGQMVLGPSEDGGLYLLGLRKAHFNAVEVASILDHGRNQTAAFENFIQDYKFLAPKILSLEFDIDNAWSVHTWRAKTRFSSFCDIILSKEIGALLHRPFLPHCVGFISSFDFSLKAKVSRGPPSAVLFLY